jgi:hypothetical protein
MVRGCRGDMAISLCVRFDFRTPVAKREGGTVRVGEPATRNRQPRRAPARPAHERLAILRTQKNRAEAVSALWFRVAKPVR